jgi:type III pantothenate kinase
MNILLMDIGNTRTKWAFVDPSTPFDISMPMNIQACDTKGLPHALDFFKHPISTIVYSSVIGNDLTRSIQSTLAKNHSSATWHQILGDSALKLVSNPYKKPEQLGADRRALVIACALGFPTKKILAISSGTTLTIDLIDSGSHIGGIIAPGSRLMSESLQRGTAALPMTDSQKDSEFTFGTSTDEAICNGIKASQVGAARTAVEWAQKEVGPIDAIILDGGDATHLSSGLQDHYPCTIIPGLVLKGLLAWYRSELND